ncbi:MAG: PilZ domain-containing protein [Xanthobacteraceae bacterium]
MSLNMSLGEADFVEADFGIRVLANIPGRYSLANLRNSQGERRVFACRAVNLSCRAIALAAPVKGKVGDRVIAHIDRLGKLEGPIDRLLERGFVMNIAASQEERSNLAAKIAWLESLKNHEVPDRRADKRIVPVNPNSKMILPDGRVENCLVLDISVSGVAVSADTIPAVGTILAVGSVVGRVVRHFADGFAIQFIQRQHQVNVESVVILSG